MTFCSLTTMRLVVLGMHSKISFSLRSSPSSSIAWNRKWMMRSPGGELTSFSLARRRCLRKNITKEGGVVRPDGPDPRISAKTGREGLAPSMSARRPSFCEYRCRTSVCRSVIAMRSTSESVKRSWSSRDNAPAVIPSIFALSAMFQFAFHSIMRTIEE
jgi:hypothetical protein